MLKRLVARISDANVMATLALFFALGGTAVASKWITGADIRDGSITGVDVKDRSLSDSKLARNSITGKLVRNRSLTGADIRDGSLRAGDFNQIDLQQLRGPQGEPGAPGIRGVQGAQGPKGDKGDPGSSDIARLSTTAPDMPNFQPGIVITESVPAEGGWLILTRVDAVNTSANDDDFGCALSVGGQEIGGNITTVAPPRRRRSTSPLSASSILAKPSTLSAKAAPPRLST